MCGICGVQFKNNKSVTVEMLRRMVQPLHHRGPDDSGFFVLDGVGFAHTRLSIIDLSEHAQQPLFNERRDIVLVANGEIYNYLELRELLVKKGHTFVSNSDSEVVVHAYEEYGLDFVNYFNGMWSFAILDLRKRVLVLSRDRLGVKPLYYLCNHEKFAFSSEIKSLLAIFPDEKIMNNNVLFRFLVTGITDAHETSFYKNIKILPSAHCLVLDLNRGDVRIHRYWNIDPRISQSKYNYRFCLQTFENLLDSAITYRLRSDVPIGACLSGGMDSSMIAAIASMKLNRSLDTFTVYFKDKGFEEKPYADAVVSHLKLTGVAHSVSPYPQDLLKELSEIMWYLDEPVSSQAVYSQFHLMKLAKEKVKVLLGGQGGDEILGGYFTFFPSFVRNVLNDFMRSKNPFHFLNYFITCVQIHKLCGYNYFVPILNRSLPRRYRKIIPWILKIPYFRNEMTDKIDMRDYLHRDFLHTNEGALQREDNNALDVFGEDLLGKAMSQATTKTVLPALLRHEDRLSMAFSIESRTPFLDFRLVEFAAGLPYNFKIRGNTTKFILRKAAKKFLPRKVLSRKTKKGFPTPMGQWIKEQKFSEQIKDLLSTEKFQSRGIFRKDKVLDLIDCHCSGKIDASKKIFMLLSFELWCNIFIDR